MSERVSRLERLMFLSDGVYAIALTPLAVELVLPESAADLHGRDLMESLLESWPKVLAFLTSFMVIANFWVGHNVLFQHVRRFDGGLMWLVALGIGRLINPLLLFAFATLCFIVLGVLEWREEGDEPEEAEGQGPAVADENPPKG